MLLAALNPKGKNDSTLSRSSKFALPGPGSRDERHGGGGRPHHREFGGPASDLTALPPTGLPVGGWAGSGRGPRGTREVSGRRGFVHAVKVPFAASDAAISPLAAQGMVLLMP
ncbi:hypothetical protein GCM10009754_70960 [Amycolatopsis minnesotensis]|uniref:Uncharacterized protein n=1 Tax=Amycolatopsis minnesotensis TaxID=337894 RepID=A0ABN2SBV7_9PSEU